MDAHKLFLVAALALGACNERAAAAGTPYGWLPIPGAAAAAPAAATKFFLPTGEPDNTAAPTIETDARGGVHIVYPAYAGGRAYYAYCAPGCSAPGDVKVVRFDTKETIHNIMVAVDGEGRPQVLLAGAQRVYYAVPQGGDFTRQDAWKLVTILDHGGDREVSGEAFALDPQGRPRFMMHTYKAYLGVGQKPPQAFYVRCDADCAQPASWRVAKIADQMWRGSNLRFDAAGVARAVTVVDLNGTPTAAYVECAGGCDDEASWKGTGLLPVFESETEAVRVTPAVSLALTRKGAPRVLVLGLKDGKRNLTYFECDEGCTGDHWTGSILSDFAKLDAGVDLALDADDHPRFVHTLDYNIALASCDQARCAAPDAKWKLTKVEYGGEMKPDQIFPYPNCNVGAWFLHDPTIALARDGRVLVGYQARDVSGGWTNPDKTRPACRAGTDMTWSRMAVLPALN